MDLEGKMKWNELEIKGEEILVELHDVGGMTWKEFYDGELFNFRGWFHDRVGLSDVAMFRSAIKEFMGGKMLRLNSETKEIKVSP